MLLIIQEELEKKTHNYELIESDSVVFCVDYALNGIGSNSLAQLYWISTDLMMYYSGSVYTDTVCKGIIKFQ